MKNKFTVLLALSLVLIITLGCSFGGLFGGSDSKESSSSSEKKDTSSSSSEKKKEVTPSGDIVKVGIPECDELATYINDNAEAIGEESIVVRGIVEMYKQTIFSNMRDSVEKMNDEQKAKMGENCKKALENLKKQMKK
jgi:hypothetical protein